MGLLNILQYAWDEPTLPPHITCNAPGGSSATYNMNVIGEGSQLTYENFIYIAMTGTFTAGTNSAAVPGTNSIKIGLPGKLIFSNRKCLREIIFS